MKIVRRRIVREPRFEAELEALGELRERYEPFVAGVEWRLRHGWIPAGEDLPDGRRFGHLTPPDGSWVPRIPLVFVLDIDANEARLLALLLPSA